MCKVISIVNEKGGVAKTTTVYAISEGLVKKGKKVLMIDFDPQASLTITAGYDGLGQITNCISDLLINGVENGGSIEIGAIIRQLTNGVNLIPSSTQLVAVETSLINVMGREYILDNILDEFRQHYDYIVIDCSPSLSLLTINALAASDSVIIPVTAEYLAIKGLEVMLQTIIRIKRRINRNLEFEGILFTKFKERNRLTKEVVKMLSDAYEGVIPVFESKIACSTKVAEAAMYQKSIIEYAPKHKSAQAYIHVVEEILANA
ncbi:MAG: AAA family ATPase [Clostridium sp.]|nr:AAA family ATPase [Clostridium sp.]